jgi:hypothetical protein
MIPGGHISNRASRDRAYGSDGEDPVPQSSVTNLFSAQISVRFCAVRKTILHVLRASAFAVLAIALCSCDSSQSLSVEDAVRAIQMNATVREHVNLAIFPAKPSTKPCAIHVGGGARAIGAPGDHLAATCKTSVGTVVREQVVVFQVHWKHFRESGFYACKGSGVAAECLENPASAKREPTSVDRYTWTFRLDRDQHILETNVHGAFPPWWVVNE